jgi:hypothetical protein
MEETSETHDGEKPDLSENGGLNGNKKGTNLLFPDLSHQVIPLGFEPRTHTLKVYCSTS